MKTKPLPPLTDKQTAILRFIVRYTQENFYQPSVREIMKKFRIKSPNGIHRHLRALARKGYIGLANERRAIRILADPEEFME